VFFGVSKRGLFKVQSRRYFRIKTNTRAVIRTPSVGEEGLNADVTELGLGGCLLRSGSAFGVGRVLRVALSLGQREIQTVARIVYEWKERDSGVCSGMEFLFLTPDDRTDLSEYVKSFSGRVVNDN